MYKVLEFDSEKAGDKLSHGEDVFHEALRKQLEYCHVYKDDQPLYDLQKIDNNYTIKTSKGARGHYCQLFLCAKISGKMQQLHSQRNLQRYKNGFRF